jgi:hypothetical protein
VGALQRWQYWASCATSHADVPACGLCRRSAHSAQLSENLPELAATGAGMKGSALAPLLPTEYDQLPGYSRSVVTLDTLNGAVKHINELMSKR